MPGFAAFHLRTDFIPGNIALALEPVASQVFANEVFLTVSRQDLASRVCIGDVPVTIRNGDSDWTAFNGEGQQADPLHHFVESLGHAAQIRIFVRGCKASRSPPAPRRHGRFPESPQSRPDAQQDDDCQDRRRKIRKRMYEELDATLKLDPLNKLAAISLVRGLAIEDRQDDANQRMATLKAAMPADDPDVLSLEAWLATRQNRPGDAVPLLRTLVGT